MLLLLLLMLLLLLLLLLLVAPGGSGEGAADEDDAGDAAIGWGAPLAWLAVLLSRMWAAVVVAAPAPPATVVVSMPMSPYEITGRRDFLFK